jgi:hypothetical protein
MGRIVRQNKKGKYQMESTITDSLVHEKKWLSEDELKKEMIESEIWTFIEAVLKIDSDFLFGYTVNGKRVSTGATFNMWWLAHSHDDDFEDMMGKKFTEIIKRLGINFKVD